MIERCFVKVAFDPATSGGQLRRAVGGFLRYIQHRDLHPTSELERPAAQVAGLVKYVAYRDRASARAELFGPPRRIGTPERKAFVDFVTRSIEGSKPQLFRTRAGSLMDRRRAVSRFLISPESAQALNLEQLTRAAVSRLESEMGVADLRWIAAIHRNTAHHHVHLVLAGMHQDASGGYRRVDIGKQRLVAIKDAVGREIERQRGERAPIRSVDAPVTGGVRGRDAFELPALKLPVAKPALIRALPVTPPALNPVASAGARSHVRHVELGGASILALRVAARRYQRRMERELEVEARRFGREWGA